MGNSSSTIAHPKAVLSFIQWVGMSRTMDVNQPKPNTTKRNKLILSELSFVSLGVHPRSHALWLPSRSHLLLRSRTIRLGLMKNSTRIIRKLLLTVILPLAIIPAFYLFENWKGQHAWEKYK